MYFVETKTLAQMICFNLAWPAEQVEGSKKMKIQNFIVHVPDLIYLNINPLNWVAWRQISKV